MNRRAIFWYWLLLFVPTLVVGAVAFRLIRHEGERIAAQARATALDRARAVADSIRLTVSMVEDEMGESLRRIPPEALNEILAAWEKDNPLVRNVFVWQAGRGLLLPPPQNPMTAEERSFVARYEALFSGRIPWLAAATHTNRPNRGPVKFQRPVSAKTIPVTSQLSSSNAAQDIVQQAAQIRIDNRQLMTSAWQGGWIPWFDENRLHILGWVQRDDPKAPVYGLELELATLLSRLLPAFPAAESDGTTYVLLDDSGNIVHQVGRMELKAGTQPDLTAELAPYLPHWTVGVFLPSAGMLQAAGHSFMLLAGLLLAIVVVAILAGGTLLSWQAQRHMAEALQKTSFVSNISHELKTPLTSIRMYAELLGEGRVKDPGKITKYLQVIAVESQRLTRLVNNVLDFSRLEQGKKKYRVESLDCADFVRRFLETHRLRLAEAGLKVSAELPAEPVWLFADRDALEQVLLNLVDNVIKYAAEGGELQITLERQGDHWRLAVMDRGPGIAPRHRVRIFERFYRVDDSLTASQPGSGLGLSIARRLLRDLGGELTFEPRVGGGSCFVARLPAGAGPKGMGETETETETSNVQRSTSNSQ